MYDIYIYIHTYIYIYICLIYIYIYVYIYIYLYVYNIFYIYIHLYIHTCIHTCIHTYIHIYIYVYIYIDTRIGFTICTCTWMCFWSSLVAHNWLRLDRSYWPRMRSIIFLPVWNDGCWLVPPEGSVRETAGTWGSDRSHRWCLAIYWLLEYLNFTFFWSALYGIGGGTEQRVLNGWNVVSSPCKDSFYSARHTRKTCLGSLQLMFFSEICSTHRSFCQGLYPIHWLVQTLAAGFKTADVVHLRMGDGLPQPSTAWHVLGSLRARPGCRQGAEKLGFIIEGDFVWMVCKLSVRGEFAFSRWLKQIQGKIGGPGRPTFSVSPGQAALGESFLHSFRSLKEPRDTRKVFFGGTYKAATREKFLTT